MEGPSEVKDCVSKGWGKDGQGGFRNDGSSEVARSKGTWQERGSKFGLECSAGILTTILRQ